MGSTSPALGDIVPTLIIEYIDLICTPNHLTLDLKDPTGVE